MAFYDHPKENRATLVKRIQAEIHAEVVSGILNRTIVHFANDDTYIRKAAYESIGRMYLSDKALLPNIKKILESLLTSQDFKIRQTVLNAAGEIGKTNFDLVEDLFDKGLFDIHHSPRNAVIGSIKKMGEKNPIPVLQ